MRQYDRRSIFMNVLGFEKTPIMSECNPLGDSTTHVLTGIEIYDIVRQASRFTHNKKMESAACAIS
jgi:hypothetical protein